MFEHSEELAGGEILISKGENLALVELNRPEHYNALTSECLRGLQSAMQTVSADDEVRAVVLTGRGKAFTAGVDLKALSGGDSMMSGNEFLGPDSPLLRSFSDCPKPIIGAINGVAVTGGFEIALACDFLYAAESARFADTHARVGIIPGWGLSQKLPRLVGINRAREISFTGNYFSAMQAMEWGLVNRVLPDDQLLTGALDTARQIATCLPEALYRIKQMMNSGWDTTLGEGMQQEGQAAGAFNSQVDVSAMAERLAQLKKRSKQTR